jgi:5-methylcytosine-specific restriction endonuclease McrA
MLCEYGCNKESNFTLKNGRHCCSPRPAGCEIQKKINSNALKNAYKTGEHRLSAGGRNYHNFPQSSKDAMAWNRGKTITSNDVIFVEHSKYTNELVKGRILKDSLIVYQCMICKIKEWQNENIVLELDHINGVNNDNRLTNLRFLCPNCHSQTLTYKGRNKNTGKIIVTDEELLTAYHKEGNIHRALKSVGLAAKGGNYSRINRIIRPLGGMADTGDLKPPALWHTSSNLVAGTINTD